MNEEFRRRITAEKKVIPREWNDRENDENNHTLCNLIKKNKNIGFAKLLYFHRFTPQIMDKWKNTK